MLRPWLPSATGAALAAAAPVLWWSGAAASTVAAAALAGVTLFVVALPEPGRRPDDPRSLHSWLDLQRAMGLHGPAVAPDGRTFLAARPLAVPPLSDGRTVYDGQDGHAAGLAFWNPAQGTLDAFATADDARLRDVASLEEDLGALASRHLGVSGLRVLPEPGGLRVRYQSRVAPAGKPGAARRHDPGDDLARLRFLMPAAAARAARRVAFVTEARDGEIALRWVDA